MNLKDQEMTNDFIKGKANDLPAKTTPTKGVLSTLISMVGKGFRYIRSKWSVRYWVRKTTEANGAQTVEREFTLKKDY
jgi:hypothetical protein